jgi:hypothetical protein
VRPILDPVFKTSLSNLGIVRSNLLFTLSNLGIVRSNLLFTLSNLGIISSIHLLISSALTVTVPKSDLWMDEKTEAWDRAEENYRPSLGWLGEVFSRPGMLRLSPNMLPTVTVADKKCVIRSVGPVLPMPSRHVSAGYLCGH